MVGGSDPKGERMDHYIERMRVLAGEGAKIPFSDKAVPARVPSDDLTTEETGGAKVPSFNFTVNLDGELAQYGPDIRRFVEAMTYKLAKNAHKGKWEGLSIEEAFDRLKEETAELQAEVHGTRNMVAVMLEAADVANFALIVAAIAMERGR